MVRYIASRVAHTLLVLVLASVAVSSMLDLVPGDPALAILGESATPETIKQVHERLGLDRPYFDRYGDWATDVVTGDFGEAYYSREKVTTLIIRALPITAELVVLTLLLSLAISIPVGIYSAKHAGKRLDRSVTAISSVVQAMPAFTSVPLLVFAFVLKLPIFPATGWVDFGDDPILHFRHLVLPCFALSLSLIPLFVAALRSDMITTLSQDFVLNARAKGMSERTVLYRHALRPSSFSLFTLAALALGQLISGAVIVEVLFVLPGLGTLTVNAIDSKDVPVVQGVVMFIAIAYVIINLLVDFGYRYLDPRVRMKAG